MAEISNDAVCAIAVQSDKQLLIVRQLTISEAGVERGVFQFSALYPPGADVSGFDANTRTIANSLWTADVVAAWQAAQETPQGDA